MKRCPVHNVRMVFDETTTEEEYTGFGMSTRNYRETRFVCPFAKDGCEETFHQRD